VAISISRQVLESDGPALAHCRVRALAVITNLLIYDSEIREGLCQDSVIIASVQSALSFFPSHSSSSLFLFLVFLWARSCSIFAETSERTCLLY